MLKLDAATKQFTKLTEVALAEAGHKERGDLQQFILNSADAFFGELDEDLFLVGQEVQPSSCVQDRIDLLAFDRDGAAVVIELKRGSNKWQLGQALSYAAMVAQWTEDELWQRIGSGKREALMKYLDAGLEQLNQSQRILLIAEDYAYEVLVAAQWLAERGIDIACCRISLAVDAASGSQYVACSRVCPPAELEDLANQRGPAWGAKAARQKTWKELLERCQNPAEIEFFRKRFESEQRTNSHQNALAYPETGTIRWYAEIKARVASVYQVGRFRRGSISDEEFWRERLSEKDSVAGLKRGLRFHLVTQTDFETFEHVVMNEAASFQWQRAEQMAEKKAPDEEPEEDVVNISQRR